MVDKFVITTSGIYNSNLGEWVRAADYEALEAKLAALVEAAERVVADTLNWNVNAADLIKLDQAISAAKEKPNG